MAVRSDCIYCITNSKQTYFAKNGKIFPLDHSVSGSFNIVFTDEEFMYNV